MAAGSAECCWDRVPGATVLNVADNAIVGNCAAVSVAQFYC